MVGGPDLVQVIVSLLTAAVTVVGSVYAVRYEVRSRVDALNKQVVELQDRKIRLLDEQLATEREVRLKLESRVAELAATVQEQALTIARLEREKRGGRRVDHHAQP